MPGTTGFRLDDEQRERVRDSLEKAGASLIEPFEKFIDRIESSIDCFSAAKPEGTFRETRDPLRAIWRLSHEDDPSPGVLRGRVKSLPPLALEYLGRRARDVLPRLFPGEITVGDVFEPPSSFVARFLAWVERADGAALITASRVLSADGGRWVPGRSRGDGKRSAPQLEPRVLGVIRGSPEPKPEGGRPSEDARHALVMNLARDWCLATGEMPVRGRSDQTGFGEFVHSVFQWLDVSKDPYEAATYGLRRFWEELGLAVTRPLLADCLRRHGEEP